MFKQVSSGLFKILPKDYLFTNHIYLIYIYKQDLVLDNPQGFDIQ